MVGNAVGQRVDRGLDGPAAARLPHRAARSRGPGSRPWRDRDPAQRAPGRADARLSGRRRRSASRSRAPITAPATSPTRDAAGYITYVGRADDVFKSSDYRLSPFELESALIEHPAVAEAAVVPAPDPQRLTVAKAYVVLAAGRAPTRETALRHFHVPEGAARALQAHPPHRIQRIAEDHLRQDPPRRAAPSRGRARRQGRKGRGRIPDRGFSGTGKLDRGPDVDPGAREPGGQRRRPAGNHGDAGLGEAGYKFVETPASTRPGTGGADVPGLAEPGGRETPGRESRRRRPRRAPRYRGVRMYPGSLSPAVGRAPGQESPARRRPRRGRVQGWGDAGLGEAGYRVAETPASTRPGKELRRRRRRRGRVQGCGGRRPRLRSLDHIAFSMPWPLGVFMPSQVPLATYFQAWGS